LAATAAIGAAVSSSSRAAGAGVQIFVGVTSARACGCSGWIDARESEAVERVLDRFRPWDEWYLHDPNGIHGLGHAARVLVWTEQVADAMEGAGLTVDREVVRCAAMVHDVRRVDDGSDREHGARAAAWVIANADLLPVALTQTQLEAVRYCCEWHVPPDGSCPEMTVELR
jgi:hypothetical protein